MIREWEAHGGPLDGRCLGPPHPLADTLLVPSLYEDETYKVNRRNRRYDYVSPGVLPPLDSLTDFRRWPDED